MGKYYFYTNPNELNAQQDIHHAFGPVIDPSDPQIEPNKDKYRITNLHTTAQEAPAVAICDGTICVIEDDSAGSTVTIVLKPHYQPSFDFPFIKYFLFKGVRRSSIISGTAAVLDADIPFTERLDESWDEDGGANPKTNSAQALGLAYTPSFMHPIDGTPTAIFADDQPIDNLFYYPNDDFQLPVVRAGEYIGYSDQAKFGFQIVLERLGYEPEISLARSLENVISVDSFTRANPEPDDADYFMHWHEKEACINYIDPCAFFGSFCGSKVFYKTGTGSGSSDRTKCNTPQEIHDGILKHFENRHKIYIDIRNDYNFSLNYFKDYGFGIRFHKRSDSVGASDPATNQTNANGWPITTVDLSKISASGDIKRKFFRTSIRLPTGSNSEPLVYLSKAYVRRFQKLKRKFKAQSPNKLDGVGQLMDFNEPVNISFPLIENGGSENFCSSFYKLNYYDQNRDGNPAATLAPSKEHYFNGIFRPHQMRSYLRLLDNQAFMEVWHSEILVKSGSSDHPSYIAKLGKITDPVNVTYFAVPSYYCSQIGRKTGGKAHIEYVTKLTSNETDGANALFEKFQQKTVSKQDFTLVPGLEKVEIFNSTHSFNIASDQYLRILDTPEDYLIYILSAEENSDLLDDIVPLPLVSPHLSFLELNLSTETQDNTGKVYVENKFLVSTYAVSTNKVIKAYNSVFILGYQDDHT